MEDLQVQEVKLNQDLLVKTGQSPLPLLPDVPPGPLPQVELPSLWLPPVEVRMKCPLAWLSAT